MFEAVGAYTSGHIDEKELHSFECTACPTCGSCSGMFTANSMNCLLEALGMALPGNGTIPMVYSARLALAKQAGEAVMGLIGKNVCPRDILTPTAVKNAERVDMAIGASSNSVLHLLALASELGFTKEQLSIDTMNEISKTTPNLCRLAPAGEYYIEELNEVGGISAVIRSLIEAGSSKAKHSPARLRRRRRARRTRASSTKRSSAPFPTPIRATAGSPS